VEAERIFKGYWRAVKGKNDNKNVYCYI